VCRVKILKMSNAVVGLCLAVLCWAYKSYCISIVAAIRRRRLAYLLDPTE
jgi:hypothetical protein